MMKVIAHSISPTEIVYECPHCRSHYKKNGTPTKRAKAAFHTHGNPDKSSKNRSEHRHHHAVRDDIETFTDVEIIITDDTLKFDFDNLSDEMKIDELFIS